MDRNKALHFSPDNNGSNCHFLLNVLLERVKCLREGKIFSHVCQCVNLFGHEESLHGILHGPFKTCALWNPPPPALVNKPGDWPSTKMPSYLFQFLTGEIFF